MKTIYQIFLQPFRSSVIISSALAALLVIHSTVSVLSGSAGYASGAVAFNTVLALMTIVITLLPGLYLRILSYKYFSNVENSSIRSEKFRSTAIFAIIVETLNVTFLLSAYMGSVTAGGVGILGNIAIAGFNVFWLIVWGIAASILAAGRSRVIESKVGSAL